jgi:hypothetical protein
MADAAKDVVFILTLLNMCGSCAKVRIPSSVQRAECDAAEAAA